MLSIRDARIQVKRSLIYEVPRACAWVSTKRKWKFRLRHIIEAIDRIESYTVGISFEQFSADSRTFDAVVRNLTIIGEAARLVPAEIESAFPGVPWAEMRALRNILTH